MTKWECKCDPKFLEEENFPLELSIKAHIEVYIDRQTGKPVAVNVSGSNQGDADPEEYMFQCFECGTWFDDMPMPVGGDKMGKVMEKALEELLGVKTDG